MTFLACSSSHSTIGTMPALVPLCARRKNKKHKKEKTTVFKRNTQFSNSKKEKKDHLRRSKSKFMRIVAATVSALAPTTAVLSLTLFASACATVDSNQMTLKEWQRTHLKAVAHVSFESYPYEYRERVQRMLDEKSKGQDITVAAPEAPQRAQIIDL